MIRLGAERRRFRGRLQLDLAPDRASWGILAGRFATKTPVDRAAGVEIAQNAIPTPAWTAHRTRRPQRPTRLLRTRLTERTKDVR
jgi:hypothetical protein